MSQFKVVFNAPSLYDILFFDVISATEYRNLEDFKKNDQISYYYWLNKMEKMGFPISNESYMNKTQFIPEYSKIISIIYGGLYIENGSAKKYSKIIVGDENIILDRFFKIIDNFKNKKQDGFLCGHNIKGNHIPFLIKRGIKHNFKIPKLIKNNLIAKPWENNIIDTVDLWKFTGNEYVSLDLIGHFLGIEENQYYDITQINKKYWEGNTDNLNYQYIGRFNFLIELYCKLREI